MAKSEQSRQKKLAKKHSKVKLAKKELARKQQRLTSLFGKMEWANRGEIIECSISGSDSAAEGMATVLFARRAPDGNIAAVVYLLDLYCLGVKDLSSGLRSPEQYSEMSSNFKTQRRMKTAEPGLARGLVEASVAYAASCGFSPHVDYPKSFPLWGSIEAESVEGLYEFGVDGKPRYINGPFDDAIRQKMIIQTLEDNVGSGNYDVVVIHDASNESGSFLSDAYDDQDSQDANPDFDTLEIDSPMVREIE